MRVILILVQCWHLQTNQVFLTSEDNIQESIRVKTLVLS